MDEVFVISGILIKVEVSVVSDELKVNADNTHHISKP